MKHFRFAAILLLANIALTTSALAQRMWTFLDYRTGCCDFNINYSIRFLGLNNSKWGNIYQWEDGEGTGFTVDGKSIANHKNCVYSIYTHSETVPSYTSLNLHWNSEIYGESSIHVQTTALYARPNIEELKNTQVDFTEGWTNQSGSACCLGHSTIYKEKKTESFSHTFLFDNRTGDTPQRKTWGLLLTHVIGNGGKAQKHHQWGGFKHGSYSISYNYYKYITYKANGGNGSMGQQEIKDNGKLVANSFTRDGFVFSGWGTSADGNGTFLNASATITASANDKGPVTLYAQWISAPTVTHAAFLQKERKIRLKWKIESDQQHGGKFVIYRDTIIIGTVPRVDRQFEYYFEEQNKNTANDFKYESDVRYYIYYVAKEWKDDTKNSALRRTVVVNTNRHLPINNIQAVGQDTSVVLTWTSDGYQAGWGNSFQVFINQETEPVITITPADNQTEFRWEHRSVSSHTNRQNGQAGNVWYTEEPIDACQPHTYTVKGLIDEKPFSTANVEKKGIKQGTTFTTFEASKSAYAGKVKISWQAELRGSMLSKTYTIERRRAETDDAWIKLDVIKSNDSYLTYTDETALTGVYYEYRVTVEDQCGDGTILKEQCSDIGFAQATGTVSGRITFGSSGTAVADVDVIARQTSDAENDAQHHAIYFNDTISYAEWTYPSSDYADGIFKSNQWSIQMWINPDISGQQRFIGFKSGNVYGVREIKDTTYLDKYICRPIVPWAQSKESDTDISDSYWTCERQYNVETTWKVTQFRSKYSVYVGLDANNKPILCNSNMRINSEAPVGGEVYDSKPDIKNGTSYYTFDGIKLSVGQYNHMTLTRNGDTITCYVITINNDGLPVVQSSKKILTGDFDLRGVKQMALGGFVGYMDEFRLWTKALTENEIRENYDHLLVGNEKNLETYWTFDEGLNKHFFDYSRDGSVYHSHHGKLINNGKTSVNVPSALALKARTDINGNYIIRGIPFTGEGTTYAITPTLGIHEFNPSEHLRFINNNSLVHNSTDFDDISSFPVSGYVYYDHTNYPVQGCNLYVDGTICSKDGELIETDADGYFQISVPIGMHFIQVKKNGHTFYENGRYPADPQGTGERINFNSSRTGLVFKDVTTVNLTGRVVGGDIEGNKPVGFAQSNNNLGKATLTLLPQNSDKYRINVTEDKDGAVVVYNPNSETLAVEGARPDTIQSKAWRGANVENCNKFFILTDSVTGEFSALLPPLAYSLTIRVESSGLDVVKDPIAIDLTNPQTVNKDSLVSDDKQVEYYEYHTMLRQTYHSEPVFNVTQDKRTDGSFGISSYEIEDGFGKLTLNDIYHTGSDGKIEYTYGAPLFKMGDPYKFRIEGYEEYVNMDTDEPVESHVPLENTVITIENALSSDQTVYDENNEYDAPAGTVHELKSNQVALDSTGVAIYNWRGGLPNITPPYTRTLNIYYAIGDRQYNWSGNPMSGIILGYMPSGNNFVTGAPDKLDLILRDPPGSQSFATWEKSTFIEKDTIKGSTWNQDMQTKTITSLGVTLATSSGIGFAVINTISGEDDLTIGVHEQCEGESSQTWRRKLTATRNISTSDKPEYDGAEGDLFIGSSTNFIIGDVRSVDLYRTPDDSTKAAIALHDALSTSVSFGTKFAYSKHYIEHDLIPNFVKLRNSQLTIVSQTQYENYTSYPNTTDHIIYITPYNSTDVDFGLKDTYKPILPKGESSCGDTIEYYNGQIAKWKEYLEWNEFEKADAYSKRSNLEESGKVENYSFDAGSSQTITHVSETDSVHTYRKNTLGAALLGNKTGISINNTGVVLDIITETGGGTHRETTEETDTVTTISFTLRDNDVDDAISVDVYEDYGLYHTPIFRTRGGQTTNPYEGEVKTTYYLPGTTIMEATMQVEKPKIDVDRPLITDVPSGSAANFVLRLTNQSEVSADCYFRLLVADNTNPDGAAISVDGAPLNQGRLIKVPYGETITKTMQLKQTNVSILDYERIAIVLASIGQSDPTSKMPVIADTAWVSAQFVPSSSPVELTLSTTTMNMQSGSDLTLTLSDFERDYINLKAFRLQYKPQGGEWTMFHEYVLNKADLSSISELLPETGATVSYTLPMFSYADGDYRFRVVSVSMFGAEEIYRESNEVILHKNLTRPRPLGHPEPTDGVLDMRDELSITFNEPIVRGELTQTNNFLVTGILNGAKVEHHTALRSDSGIMEPAAQTEADINLSGKSYSIDVWLYITTAGTLISHGSGKQIMSIATNDAGQVVVTLADSVYTSEASIPRNQWLFFTLSRKAIGDRGEMSIAVAYDDVTLQLFNNKNVPLYYGNGPMSAGCGAGAAIHELLLWDEARDITTALQQRSETKTPATRHLIGYWKMNEGEGKSIRDYSRSRDMVMPAETWYLNNVNKAVALDGTQHITISTGSQPPLPTDDYAMELWVKCAPQHAEAQLTQLGGVEMWLNSSGQLVLESLGSTNVITSPVLSDSKWHHVMLNVRRLGTAAIYIDGNRALTVNADRIGSFASDALIVGARRTFVNETETTVARYDYDRHLTGLVDEIRLWKTTIASDLLASKHKIRLTGQEPGLSLYYPFEKKTIDDYNQVVTVGTADEITGNGTPALINAADKTADEEIKEFSDDAPALREKPTQTNVNFSFTASDTKIVIDLDETPAALDGCIVNVTVRDVRSANGNYSLPTTWSAYVQRNELIWHNSEESMSKEKDEVKTVTNAIINRGGLAQRWSISGMPVWMSANTTSGTIEPMSTVNVDFVITDAAPIGRYEQTIYLMGDNGVETPFTLHINVTGDVPTWSANSSEYESLMSVIATLNFFGKPAENEDDIIAAFIDDECRGVANLKYEQRYDNFYVPMVIYGDDADNGKKITFQAYNASNGIVYTIVSAQPVVKYKSLSLTGTYSDPVSLSVKDQIEQRTTLKKGWNWLSLYVLTDNMDPKAILSDIADDVEIIKGHYNDIGFLIREDTTWTGVMVPLLNRRMYAVKMAKERELRLVGKQVDPKTTLVRAHYGWNWVGYYGQQRLTITNAFAAMNPQMGDLLQSKKGMSYFDDYEWVGTLQTIEPGQGYILFSSDDEKWFAYPSAAVYSAPRRAPADNPETAEEQPYTGIAFQGVTEDAYPYNMILIGQVLYNNAPVANAELGVFADEECRAVGMTDENGVILLLIPGEAETTLGFRLAVGDEILESTETVNYVTDEMVGTPSMPQIIRFGDTSGMNSLTPATGNYPSGTYDVLGREINDAQPLPHGVYIINGQKVVK